jgi:hypothetical protein
VKPIRVLFLVLLVAGGLGARELLVNGNFEEQTSFGWRWDTFGNFADTGNCHLWTSNYYDPDLDREVCVHKVLHQWDMLSQNVDVPNVNLNFSVSAKLFCKTERPDTGFYACANVVLAYLDDDDSVLGETRIYSHTGGCDWADLPTLHLIEAPDTTQWHNYSFNVADELANLAGVNPAEVRAIRVGLWSYVRNNC